MLGQRMRQARLAAGLSLEGLAARLDPPITKQALSKYETGASQPSPGRLAELASALNLRVSALLVEPTIEIQWQAYRKLATLSKARQEQVTAIAAQRLEAEVRLRELFHFGEWHDLPGRIDVQNFSDCEYAAAAVRMHWGMGYRPVDRLLEQIEERGGAVLVWPEAWGVDGLSGWANRMPVLVLNGTMPTDRLRFNAAHEIGHLVMKPTGDEKQDEKFAHRFAAAFLVPAEAARHELGTHRRGVDVDELGLLKRRWGFSMQGWIRRAHDLDIIGDDLYRGLNIRFRREGWHRTEPVQYEGNESPALLRRLVLRAMSEGLMTSEEADRLYPDVLTSSQRAAETHSSLRDLARRSLEERHRVVRDTPVMVDSDEAVAWDTLGGDEP